MAKKAKKRIKSLGYLEKHIENQIFSFLKILGIYCFKHDSVGIFDPVKKIYRTNNNPHRLKGVSDILGILPQSGKLLAIEVKTELGKATPEQRSFIQNVNENGGVAFIARSLNDVAKNLSKHFPDWSALKTIEKDINSLDFENEQ